MIFFGGGGGGGFALLIGLLMLVVFSGGRGALPLLMLLMFFGLPFLLIRGAIRSSRNVLAPGGFSRQPWPPPTVPRAGWERPRQPALPPVNEADVRSLRDRLAHDVSTLEPGDDPVARQALADASERYSTASTLLERAGSDAQLRTAWLAAVEGLNAARVVRQRLGLDLGPPIPSPPTAAPALTRHARIDIDGRSHDGAPSYEPGRPHWFPGGYYGGRPIPAGWYDVPFWPSALVLGGLLGWGMGGLMAGAMYGEDVGMVDGGMADGGYDGGGGFEDGGGGDWGGGFGGFGGGGDWGGGGGGDWGGGGGFGDFGGGGDW